MTISTVQIANFALNLLGEDSTIESLTEDSAEAKAANLWFSFARDEALAGHNWSFAKTRVALATHSEAPPDEWAYRYIYPSSCIKARLIENPAGPNADPVPFDIELDTSGNKCILTDTDEAVLIFTKLVTNPGLYTPYFVQYLATVLAFYMSFAITGKIGLTDSLGKRKEMLKIMAPAMDAQEKQERPERDSAYIRARN